MRYVAPAREAVDPQVFGRPPLSLWLEYAALLHGPHWPTLDALNALWPTATSRRFVLQNLQLLADGKHYERRIAEDAGIATREHNWHDLFNALMWLRHPTLKQALNQRQVGEVARLGPKQRSRAQYAMTHFDEGGVLVGIRDPALLALWDAHDWHGLFWRHRHAWRDGSIQCEIFGHALLEHALNPEKLLVGKALAFHLPEQGMPAVLERCAQMIAVGALLHDPLELRPLPLSGIPGWHAENADERFHLTTPCYQARRAGREYPSLY